MKKLMIAAVAAMLLGVLALPGFAQKGTKESMRKKLDYA